MRVRDFRFLVTDDRYSVLTLLFVEAEDAGAARALASRLLLEHAHYHAIEAWDAEEHLFTVGDPSRRRQTA